MKQIKPIRHIGTAHAAFDAVANGLTVASGAAAALFGALSLGYTLSPAAESPAASIPAVVGMVENTPGRLDPTESAASSALRPSIAFVPEYSAALRRKAEAVALREAERAGESGSAQSEFPR
jgi:hypothetical protein